MAVLSLVGRHRLGHGAAPQSALEVCQRRRVRARVGRVERRIALHEDVKAVARRCRVAILLALDRVVCVQSVVSQVSVALDGALLAREGERVALRDGCAFGDVLRMVLLVEFDV